MPYVRRRVRSTRSRVYRSLGYRRWRGYGSRGQYRASRQQRDQARVVLRFNLTRTIQIAANQSTGFTTVDVGDILDNNPQFSAYSAMFDEFKVNGLRLHVVPNW